MNIDLKLLDELLAVLEKRQIHEFEYSDGTTRVHVERGVASAIAAATSASVIPSHAAVPSVPSLVPAASQAPASAPQDPNVTYVTSPFVGTFYRAPSPDAAPFVDVGTHVKKGQSLCIVEAMKLMNEIESEFACTILEVLAENARPVEFGQKLFKVRKA